MLDNFDRRIFLEKVGLPQRLRVGLRIRFGDLDLENISVPNAADTLNHMKLIAMRDPDNRTLVEAHRVDNESISIPMADRVAHHVRIGIVLRNWPIEVNPA